MEQVKLNIITKAIDEKKGEDIQVFDVTGRNPFYDYVVIATIGNSRQSNAIVDEIQKNLSLINEEINHVEGDPRESDWILIDANGVIVHLFTVLERTRVNLEELLNKQSKRA
ncbi:MAG: ribosome silencing factor [Erysipelotrichaceae bacterium]|nr:ribosome silencing factor [Erysipelotrichaceae bacterium]